MCQILGQGHAINDEENRSFLLSAQSPMGGFGKEPEEYPDPYHSYLALAALAMVPSSTWSTWSSSPDLGSGLGLKGLDIRWNISTESAEWLRKEMGRIRSR